MHRSLHLAILLLLPLCACSGGGAAADAAGTAGAIHVVFDTATGSDALVQYQIAAAVLERADGTPTANLLPAPVLVTLADPSGAIDGLALRAVPGGDYLALHLLLVPGSGLALYPEGATAAVTTAPDLIVPLPEPLQHDASGTSWLAVAHQGSAPPAVRPGRGTIDWQPVLQARSAGSPQALDGLRITAVAGQDLLAVLDASGAGRLRVEFDAGCVYHGENGQQLSGLAEFLTGALPDACIDVTGRLQRDGSIVVQLARHCRSDTRGPRLIGRITALEPATTSFLMDVLATARGGERVVLPTPERVRVEAATALVTYSHTRRILRFRDLAVGNLAKVRWSQRSASGSGFDKVVASEIEITGGAACAPMQPEWQGRVEAVDAAGSSITVVPRGNDPIVIGGVAVASVEIRVDAAAILERRARNGPGRSAIGLEDIVAGVDRIWWRGSVTGPAETTAYWIRVRAD